MDVVPVVAKEIVLRLQKQSSAGSSVICTVELATLLVRIWLLGSAQTDAMGNVGMGVEQIEALVDELVEFLLHCSEPSLACLRLQSESYTLKSELLNQKRTEMVKEEALMMYLTKRVLRHGQNSTSDEVLGDIVLLILHRYGLVKNVDEAVGLLIRRDTVAALSLVLPRRKVAAFTRQDPVERRRQLEEIARVVWGIRLFNKEEGKDEGAGLKNIHELLEAPLARLSDAAEAALERLAERLTRLLAVMESPTNALPASEQRLLQEEYHHLQQLRHHFLTVRCIHGALEATVHGDVFARYAAAIAELREEFAAKPSGGITSASDDLLGSGTAPPTVPKTRAYPVLIALAEAYTAATRRVFAEIEEAGRLLDLALGSEQAYASSLPPQLAEEAMRHRAREVASREEAVLREEVERRLLKAAPPPTPGEASAAFHRVGLRVRYAAALPETFDAVTRAFYPESLCALRGFCPVGFSRGGLLREGRVGGPLIVVEGGVGRWTLPKPQYFAFRDEPALLAFAADPMRYLDAVLHGKCEAPPRPVSCAASPPLLAPREPAALLLAGLLDYAPYELYVAGARTIENAAVAAHSAREAGGRADASTQTGQIDPYFDHNYRWNEWDLRRQARKLVNLLHMRTHSTQTGASGFRRDNATQARPPKTSSTQTMQDAATQPPHVVQYIKGLRGTPASELKQVQRVIQY